MDVELRRLRYFVALAEELHFGEAARREQVTQQTLSRAIAQLERDVGRPLFVRSTRNVALTTAGDAMVAPARRALLAASEAIHAAQSGGPPPTVLRVDISSGGIETGSAILRQLSTEYPEIAVHQVEVGVERGLQLVRQGRLDVVLGLAPRLLEPGLEAEPVRREPVLIGMVDSHPWASRSAIPVGDLVRFPLLLPSPEAAGEWRSFVTAFCRRSGFDPTPWKHVTHGSAAAAAALRSGGCVVPTTAWADPPTDLLFLPLADPVPIFPWSMMWGSGQRRQPTIRAFRHSSRIAAERENWLSFLD